MLNAAPESESVPPKTPTAAESAVSPCMGMRPDGQDIVSYLRAMARAEADPIPEPRTTLQALVDKSSEAIRATFAGTSSVLLKFRSSSAKSVTAEAHSAPAPPDAAEASGIEPPVEAIPGPFAPLPVEPGAREAAVVQPEPVAQACVPSNVEPEPFASVPLEAREAAVAPEESRTPQVARFTVLRRECVRRLRAATGRMGSLFAATRTAAAAALRPSRFARLIAWRGWVTRTLRSARTGVRALRASIASMLRSAWARVRAAISAVSGNIGALRSAWGKLKAAPFFLGKKARGLRQEFSKLIAERRPVAAAEPVEPVTRKARPGPGAASAWTQPVQPDSPFRSAPVGRPEPVPPASPFRPPPVAEPVFAAADGPSVQLAADPGPAAAAASRPAALRGEVLPPEPVRDPRSRAAEPARVITMQPGVRSAAAPAGSVTGG